MRAPAGGSGQRIAMATGIRVAIHGDTQAPETDQACG